MRIIMKVLPAQKRFLKKLSAKIIYHILLQKCDNKAQFQKKEILTKEKVLIHI
jgi:hypothetical protein